VLIYKHILFILVIIEWLVVNISIIVYIIIIEVRIEFYLVYYLIFSVCECIGIGVISYNCSI